MSAGIPGPPGSPRGPHTDLTVLALARELEAANRRGDDAERFIINFLALAPFARPKELPPLARFTRTSTLAPVSSYPPLPLQRPVPPRTSRRSAQRRPRWAPPPSTPHTRSPGDDE